MTQSASNSFELDILETRLLLLLTDLSRWLIGLLSLRLRGRNGTVEELDQAESRARLAALMAEGEGRSIAT